jgi:hypothetical protein
MHLGDPVLEQGQVPVVIQQPRLDTGDVGGEPFSVAERGLRVR